MGLCILFPALCGLKLSDDLSEERLEKILTVTQILQPLIDAAHVNLRKAKTMTHADAIIQNARFEALKTLNTLNIDITEI